MAKTGAKFRPMIDDKLTKRVDERMLQERFRGSRTAWVEGVLVRYLDGLLADVPPAEGGTTDVRAVRVRRQGQDEQRKTG